MQADKLLDATAIEANEKPTPKASLAKVIVPETATAELIPNIESATVVDSAAITEAAVATTEPAAAIEAAVATIEPAAAATNATAQPVKKKRGRPPKIQEQPIDLTRIESQVQKGIAQAIAELSTACDVGCKKNSKGLTESWIGYKLHIETVDGDIPVAAVLTSASVHDSQVAIPLIRMASERVIYFYDLADAAYCSVVIREESRRQDHVSLIDHNPRRGEKIEFLPHEAQRYKTRSQAERVNGALKDNHGGRNVRVKVAAKVYTHLMFGILVIAAEQILRLVG